MNANSNHLAEASVTLRLHRRGPGLLALLSGLILTAAGFVKPDSSLPITFKTPAIVSGVCWGAALFFVRVAIRDLFGTLTVDAAGVRLRPRLCGFHLWWSELSMWCLEGDQELKRSTVFLFWKSGNNTPTSLPAKWFRASDRPRIVQALRDFASEKARRF